MPDKNLAYANIVATPTKTSWSQVYNAGKLFAVLSLQKNPSEEIQEQDDSELKEQELEEKESLSSIGKEVLETLEQEFFTLEKKNLESIKEAVEKTVEKIPHNIKSSFLVSNLVEDVIYIIVSNAGKVEIKRGDKIGTLLELNEESDKKIKFGSGQLENEDLLILQTAQFSENIDTSTLASSLDHQPPNEVAETLAPLIHGKEEGGAAAVIIQFKKTAEEEKEEEIIPPAEEENKSYEPIINDHRMEGKNYLSFLKNRFKSMKISSLSHSKKLYLTIAVVILVIFIFSVSMAVKRQNDAKVLALFNEVYPKAEQKYNEGESLMDLNQSLARDSFLAAEKSLKASLNDFPDKSKEKEKIEELLAKVTTSLEQSSGVNESSAEEVSKDSSNILAFLANNSSIKYTTTDGKNIFYAEGEKIFSVNNEGKDKKEEIEDGWDDLGGLGNYFGNIYVLDREDGILKFVKGSDGYGKSNYFSSNSPDLSDAKAIAIDNSIWILLSDGEILKYTRGKADSFKVSSLDKPFSSPSRIYTNVDIDYLYVLDNGNSRIVVLNKDGSYKEQYQAGVIKTASDFEVLEEEKKINILSSGKIFQINLK